MNPLKVIKASIISGITLISYLTHTHNCQLGGGTIFDPLIRNDGHERWEMVVPNASVAEIHGTFKADLEISKCRILYISIYISLNSFRPIHGDALWIGLSFIQVVSYHLLVVKPLPMSKLIIISDTTKKISVMFESKYKFDTMKISSTKGSFISERVATLTNMVELIFFTGIGLRI